MRTLMLVRVKSQLLLHPLAIATRYRGGSSSVDILDLLGNNHRRASSVDLAYLIQTWHDVFKSVFRYLSKILPARSALTLLGHEYHLIEGKFRQLLGASDITGVQMPHKLLSDSNRPCRLLTFGKRCRR